MNELHALLFELRARMTGRELRELQRAHEEDLNCAARSEGQVCCLDLLITGEDSR